MAGTQSNDDQNGDAQDAGQRLSTAEFRERMALWNRISTRTFSIIGLGLLAVSVAALPLAVWFKQRPGFEEERGLLGIGAAVTGLAIATGIGWLLYRDEQQAKSLGLVCPKCRRPLASGMNGILAIAMRICPHCHKRFLADESEIPGDPDGGQAAKGSVTLADLDLQLQIQQAAESKSFRRVFRGYLAVSLVCAGLSAAVIWYAGLWSYSFFPGSTRHPMRPVPMMVAVLVAGIGVIVAGRISKRQDKMRCPGCHGILRRSSILRMIGNCTSCGFRVVVDPLIKPASRREAVDHPMSRDEFRRRWRAIQIRAPLCCLAGGAAGLLWLTAVFWNAVATGRSHLRDEMDPLTAGLACFGFVIQIGVVGWTERRLRRRLVCPACDQPLTSPHIVQATGCCTHCGRQVLCDLDDAGKT